MPPIERTALCSGGGRAGHQSLAMAVVIWSSACIGGAVAPEDIDPCATDGVSPATSGGDHGSPWVPPPDPSVDETAAEPFDVAAPTPLDLPDVPPPMVMEW